MLKDAARRRFDVLMVAAIARTKLQASVLALSWATRCARVAFPLAALGT
jgi:hypothetical protein